MAMAGESSGKKIGDCDGKVAGNRQRKVGLIYDETMCKHDTPDGEDHPECPDRIRVIWEKLQLAGVSQRFILSLFFVRLCCLFDNISPRKCSNLVKLGNF